MATTDSRPQPPPVQHPPGPIAPIPPQTPRSTFHVSRGGIGALLLLAYSVLVWADWPPAAGTKYAPPPAGAGLTAAHWWDKMQALRGWSVYPEGWVWALIAPAPLARWLPLIALGLGGTAVLVWGERGSGRGRRLLALAALVGIGYGMQLGALWLKHPNADQLLLDRITNRSFTGYFTSATVIQEPATFFVGYGDAIANTGPGRLCGHCRTHSPGPIQVYWAPLQVAGALPPAWQANLAGALVRVTGITPPALPPAQIIVALLGAHAILMAAAGIAVPLYGLARLLAGPQLALRGAALGVVLPGILLMSPEFDQVYATMAAVLLYLALRGLSAGTRPAWWGLGAGAWFAVCIYGSFGLDVLAVPLLGLAVAAGLGALGVRGAGGRLAPRAAVAWLGGLAVGTTVPWALLWGLGQFDLPRVLQISGQVHLGGITALRPYGPWLLFDLVDFLQFAGLPLVVVTLATLAGRGRAGFNLYGWLFWITLAGLDVAGVARAEVGRLWLFLLPLACLAVYRAAGQDRVGRRALGGLLAAQFAVGLLLGGRWLTP